jgi:hypothetical protein
MDCVWSIQDIVRTSYCALFKCCTPCPCTNKREELQRIFSYFFENIFIGATLVEFRLVVAVVVTGSDALNYCYLCYRLLGYTEDAIKSLTRAVDILRITHGTNSPFMKELMMKLDEAHAEASYNLSSKDE